MSAFNPPHEMNGHPQPGPASRNSAPETASIEAPRPPDFILDSKPTKGFTLVEIVLALGIIAFAFVPILGMLPVGLAISREAIDATVTAQIAQQLTTEALQTDFSGLATLQKASTDAPYHFDDQGNKSTDPAGAIYTAAFDISMSTMLPANVSTQKLATVKICILNTKSGRTDAVPDPVRSRDSTKFIVLVPDNGR